MVRKNKKLLTAESIQEQIKFEEEYVIHKLIEKF